MLGEDMSNLRNNTWVANYAATQEAVASVVGY